MKNIVLIGSSAHAKAIVDIVEKENKYKIVGLIDDFREKGEEELGYEILGKEEDLPGLKDIYNIYGCIIAIGDNWSRKIVSNKIKNLEFVSTVHPSASLGKNVNIGKGTVIMANSSVGTNTTIGNFCIVNTNSSIDHDSKMYNFSSIAPGVITGGNITIGEFSAISIGAKIIQKINIGKHSVIGAASLIVKDIDDFKVYYGIPAKKIRDRKEGEKYL